MKRLLMRVRALVSIVLTLALTLGFNCAPLFADDSSALEASTAEEPRTVVRELVEQRTETSQSFMMSDGTTRADFYAEPIFYKDSTSGRFMSVDAKLETAVAAGRSVRTNKANSFALELPHVLFDDWVSMRQKDKKVSMRPARGQGTGAARLLDSTLLARAKSETDVLYSDVWDAADLEYESKAGGLKETIVVSRPTSSTSYTFDMRLDGLVPRQESDGSISLLDSDEATSLVIAKPCMWDSSLVPDSDDYTDAVRYEVSKTDDGYALVVIADESWLSDPTRVYPVRIDPTILTSAIAPAIRDTYVSSGGSTTNYSSATLMYVNNHNASYDYTDYGLAQPGSALINDMAAKYAQGNLVVDAEYRMNSWTLQGGTATVYGYRCTDPVNISTVTWNTRPNATTTYGTSVSVSTVDAPYYFNVFKIVNYWQRAGTTDANATMRFSTSSAGRRVSFKTEENSGTKPWWRVYYAPKPTVSLSTPASGALLANPTASWEYAEALGNPQVGWEVQVAGDTTASVEATCGASGSSSSTALPVPEGGFQPGQMYHVRVRVASSPTPEVPQLWSEWSDWASFTFAYKPVVSLISPASGSLAAVPSACWSYEEASELPQVEYEIQVATSTAGSIVATAGAQDDSTSATLPVPEGGFVGEQPYYVRVRAASSPIGEDSRMWSDWSDWGSFDIYPHVPVVALSSPTSGTVLDIPVAVWSYFEANEHPQVSWELEVATSTAGACLASKSGESDTTSATLPVPAEGFSGGQTYYVRLRCASRPISEANLVWSEWAVSGGFGYLAPVGKVTFTTSASEWFVEADDDDDGLADVLNDTIDQGRGSIDLSWATQPTASGYRVYLHDGHQYREVATTTAGSWSTSGKGLFPTGSIIASMSAETTSNPFALGSRDLRDDPSELYRKTSGTVLDERHDYLFKVVPYSDTTGDVDISSCATVAVALDKRTLGANDAPSHSVIDIETIAGHESVAILDTHALQLAVTDLSIASDGPAAELSRVYQSTDSTIGAFGPGWRFNFEQRIDTATLTYVDEQRNRYRFLATPTGGFSSPRGFYGEMETAFIVGELNGYRIRFKGGDSKLFGADGVLRRETDHNGKAVVYDRSVPGCLVIGAANGQAIVVEFDGGRVAAATYATEDGSRTVTYGETVFTPQDYGANNTCTYDAGTDDERSFRYDYGQTYLQGVYYLHQFKLGTNTPQTFEAFPNLTSANDRQTTIAYNGSSARVTRVGVISLSERRGIQEWDVSQGYEWNPDGSLARETRPYTFDDPQYWSTFAYSPTGEVTRDTWQIRDMDAEYEGWPGEPVPTLEYTRKTPMTAGATSLKALTRKATARPTSTARPAGRWTAWSERSIPAAPTRTVPMTPPATSCPSDATLIRASSHSPCGDTMAGFSPEKRPGSATTRPPSPRIPISHPTPSHRKSGGSA